MFSTVDPRTQAARPGNIKASVPRLLRTDRWLLVPGVVGVIMLVLGLALPNKKMTVMGPGIALLGTVGSVQRRRAKFRQGCLLPGLVVSADPVLVATVSDLSSGADEKYTMAAVVRVPASHFPAPPSVGDSCPVCALYSGDLRKPAWNGFDPTPIWTATDDPAQLGAALERFNDDDWAELDAAIRKVPTPLKPGFYRVDITDTIGGISGWTPKQLGKV